LIRTNSDRIVDVVHSIECIQGFFEIKQPLPGSCLLPFVTLWASLPPSKFNRFRPPHQTASQEFARGSSIESNPSSEPLELRDFVVASIRTPASLDLFDDPPWEASPESRHVARRPSPVFPLAMCAIGSMALAASTLLPWYGSDTVGGVSGWHLSSETSALSTFLLPSVGSSPLSPGTYNWGYLILGLSCAVAALSGIALIVVPYKKESKIRGTTPLLYGIVIATLTLVVLVALETHARPPFGDSPPLRFDWGAIVGIVAATLSLIGGCWALFVVTRSTTELDVT
jgi:hypothetical protein